MSKLLSFYVLFLIPLQASVPDLFASAASALDEARRYFQSGDYGKAASAYENEKRGQDSIPAYLGLADVQIETGKYAQAEATIREALALSPNQAPALTLLGDVLRLTGRYQAAKASYSEALAADPNLLRARLRLGEMQWQWGEHESARQTLNYLIDYYKRNNNLSGEALNLVAQACVYLNRVRDANGLFADAVKADRMLWQAFIPWGNLMLSKYNIPDAQGIFQDALKINPNAPAANLGLARTYRSTDFERAIASAQKALEVNPNFVPAHDFLIELKLATGDSEGMQKLIESALNVNRNSLSTLTWQAVAHYLADDMAKFHQLENRILAINPKYANLYFEVAEMLAQRYLFKESVVFYRRAVALDREHWSAFAGLGTSLSRLGAEEAAKLELEKSFKNDPYNKHVGNLLTLFDEFPDYKTYRTKHLTIRIHEKDDEVLSPYAKELADESFGELLQRYPIDTGEEVILEIFPSHDDFAVRCFGLPGAEAFLGICFGNVVAMDSPRARSSGDFVWGETLWHELVHVTHLRLTANRIPRWLAEGIAVYETSRARPYWSMNLDLPFILAFQNDRTLPLKELDSGFNRPTTPGQVTLSYFQSSLVVEFIVAEFGQDKLVATFPEFRAGRKTPEVIKRVFGKDVDEFDEEFHNYIRQKYRLNEVDYAFDPTQLVAEPDKLEGILIDEVAENPNNPMLNFRLGMYYKSLGDFEGAIAYLERARELFPGFVDHENPYIALAEIYVDQNRPAAAIAELQALTARNGKNLATLKQLARLCDEAGDTACTIAAAEKAIFITPFDSEAHLRLARAYLQTGAYERAIREFEVNLGTDPQDRAGAYCDLAEAYLKAGRGQSAKESALAALEIAPNYERAQEILLASIEP